MNAHDVYFAGLLLQLAWLGISLRSGPGANEPEDPPLAAPPAWPEVVAIVPARDEAAVIAGTLGALLAQDYPGPFRIVLVDDGSTDGTADIARSLPLPGASRLSLSPVGRGRMLDPLPTGKREMRPEGAREREGPILTILPAPPRPPGWTGKLHAVSTGIAAVGSPRFLWLTDADIHHKPETLRALVTRALADDLVLNSRMALLATHSEAERWIVPAFVWFFRLLYPFTQVNNRLLGTAAAAGGCMLVDAAVLARAGGIAAIRGALIDDVAMGRLMKAHGRIRLSLTHASVSVRVYGWRDLFGMIARSAYAQLGYSPLLLAGALAGLALLFWGPVALAIVGHDRLRWLPLAWMAFAFAPMLRFYRLSPLRALALPLIATFYLAATLASAVQHWRGRGGMWKGRAQAAGMAA